MSRQDILTVLKLMGFSFKCYCCGHKLSKPLSIVRGTGDKCASEECSCAQP